MNNQYQGKKNDQNKLRMDLIPPEAIYALAEVLTFGAKKYEDRNWEKGIKLDRLFAACQRHLWAMWSGELFDKESGLPHSYHALTNIAMYITLGMRKGNVLQEDVTTDRESIVKLAEEQLARNIKGCCHSHVVYINGLKNCCHGNK